MQVTIEIPDSVVAQLNLNGKTVSRELLEAFAVEGYRTEKLSRGQVSQLLDLNYFDTEEFLAQHGALLHYDLSDLEHDRETLRKRLWYNPTCERLMNSSVSCILGQVGNSNES